MMDQKPLKKQSIARTSLRTILSTSHRRKGMFETSERVIIEQFQLAQQITKEGAEDLTLLFGASITSVLTESLVWFIQLYYAREVMNELTILPHVMKVALATAVMTGILVVVKLWVHFSPMLNVMILAVIGMLVYGIIVVGFKIINIEEIKKLLKHS